MHPTMHLDDATSNEVVTEQSRVDCCRHENNVQIRKCLHHVTQQHQQKISLSTVNKAQQLNVQHTNANCTQ